MIVPFDPENPQLSTLFPTEDPQAVIAEGEKTIRIRYPDIDFSLVKNAFEDLCALFTGDYPGYRECTTEYHDLKHSTDVFTAMTRLVHGAAEEGMKLSEQDVIIGLAASLMHDTGYIQTAQDKKGTGAKYTQTHEQRSITFLERYLTSKNIPKADIEKAGPIIMCTDLAQPVGDLSFASEDIEKLGKMLGTADLVGQMADRIYLEKLLFLFCEFKEANVTEYESEFDLYEKTISFFDLMDVRLSETLDNMRRFLLPHFKARWSIDRDLYTVAIEHTRRYLKYIIKNHPKEFTNYLRRNGIVEALRQRA